MPQKPRVRPLTYRQNRREYLNARREGWKLFEGTKTKPWEKRLLVKSLRVVLGSGIGAGRKINETPDVLKGIIPLAAKELKEVTRSQIPEKDWLIFSKLMNWYAKNPKEFAHGIRPPEEIRELGKRLNEKSFRQIESVMVKSRMMTFRIKNEDRWYHKDRLTFQEALEFQLRHDIVHSLHFITNFLEQTRK